MSFRPRAFLVDLSGTVHVENLALPGAVEAVQKIKEARIPCLFVTNTTKVP
jgi:ribonucleotide monophosphatase NagD (HAD superfamily)